MKKILLILIFGLLWCNVGIAGEQEPGKDKKCYKIALKEFNKEVKPQLKYMFNTAFYFACSKDGGWTSHYHASDNLEVSHKAAYRECYNKASNRGHGDCYLFSVQQYIVWGGKIEEIIPREDEFLSTWSDEVNPIPKNTLSRLLQQKNLLERMKKLRLKGDDWKYECTKEDFVKYVAIEEGCIGILKLGKIDKTKKKLVIFLHGDRKNNSDYNIKKEYPFSSIIKDQKENINFFYLARPGHKFNGRTRSTGKETSGEQKGSWNAIYKKSWDQIKLSAKAIKKLKEHYQPDELILIGSSGGAHLTAITLGRMPGLINKAILVGCSCTSGWPDDVSPWESPRNQIKNIDPNAKIILITGDKDEVTPALQAEAYAKKAKKRSLNAQIHIVKGGHSILGKKEVKKIIKEAL